MMSYEIKLLVSISQIVYELTMQILLNYVMLLYEQWWWDQVTILHMARQLSCRDMCITVTWLDCWNEGKSKKISVVSSRSDGVRGPLASEVVNLLKPSDEYMHQQTKPWLVEMMACCLVSTKPLYKPQLAYHQLEQTSVKFESKFKYFHSRKCISNCHLQNGSQFLLASIC